MVRALFASASRPILTRPCCHGCGREDLRACEVLMQAAMYAREVNSGSSRQATPLVAEALSVLQLSPDQATQLAGMSTQLARLKREIRKVDKCLAGLIARSRYQLSGAGAWLCVWLWLCVCARARVRVSLAVRRCRVPLG